MHNRAVVLALTCLALGHAIPAHAQLISRERVTFSAMFTRFQTGDRDINCPDASGISVGVDARTAGPLFVGGAVQLHMAGVWQCGGAAILVPFEGGFAEEVAGVELRPAPSLTLMAGLQSVPQAPIAVAAGLRLLWASVDRVSGTRREPVFWLGGVLMTDRLMGPVGFGAELGMLRAPIRLMQDGVALRKFSRWEPLWQVAVRFRPWRGP
jgi:hypothetical protein